MPDFREQISIIIPSYNTASLTLRCIEQVLAHPPSASFEIIVVDNHSSDDTCDRITATYPRVKLVRHLTNAGFSRACNRGAAEAMGRFLLFLNSDTEAQPQTFDTLAGWLERHGRTAIVGPKLSGAEGRLLQMSWVYNPILFGEMVQQYFAPYSLRQSPFKQRLVRFLQRKSCHVPSMCGACLMIRREVFDQLGGFDEHFELYFEDSDLCLRCKKAGWYIDFVSEAHLVHHLGQSSRGVWNDTSLIYQQSHIAYYRKHASIPVVLFLKVYLFFKWLRLRCVVWFEKDDRARAEVYVDAYLKMIMEQGKITLEEGTATAS